MKLKILFVRSGNKGQHPITQNQGDILVDLGLEVEYCDVVGKGLFGYLKNLPTLLKVIKAYKPDVIHAHYSLCGILSALTFRKPIVVSLMGSDVLTASRFYIYLIRMINFLFWSAVIVKSKEMYDKLGISNALILPNSVDGKKFYPTNRAEARRELGWSQESKIILFPSDPQRIEKNYKLFQDAFQKVSKAVEMVEEKHLVNVSVRYLNLYYNAADVMVLTSAHEGSPNVIKEAMFCDCPFVSVEVGDVRQWYEMTSGNSLCGYDSLELSDAIIKTINQNVIPDNSAAKFILDAKQGTKPLVHLYYQLMNRSV